MGRLRPYPRRLGKAAPARGAERDPDQQAKFRVLLAARFLKVHSRRCCGVAFGELAE
jgi:hypothetical protein